MSAEAAAPSIVLPRAAARRRRRPDPSFWVLGATACLILAFLYLPVVVLIVFSFNDNVVTTLPLKGFTLGWYEAMLNNPDMLSAIGNSFYVAGAATLLTLAVGVPAAFALDRASFPG